jgi:membrane-associated phospholipid phosphatase
MGTLLGSMLVSRVLLGVHYPSDVLSGALLGAAVASMTRRWMTSTIPATAREA